jgi:hypothetical protein
VEHWESKLGWLLPAQLVRRAVVRFEVNLVAPKGGSLAHQFECRIPSEDVEPSLCLNWPYPTCANAIACELDGFDSVSSLLQRSIKRQRGQRRLAVPCDECVESATIMV